MMGESDSASPFTGAVATARTNRPLGKTIAWPSAPRNAPTSHVENGAVNGDAANTNNAHAHTTRNIGKDCCSWPPTEAKAPPLPMRRGFESTSVYLFRKVRVRRRSTELQAFYIFVAHYKREDVNVLRTISFFRIERKADAMNWRSSCSFKCVR